MLERRRTLRTPGELAAAGLIAPNRVAELEKVSARYAVAITPAIADLIDPADPDDPIARQFVPSEAELLAHPDERSDPIGDARHTPVEGVVHRHRDRALLKLTHVCPVYCRFCFRRETVGPGEDRGLAPAAREAAFGYIAAHPEIWEVILTGGDPFMVSARRMRETTSRLAAIGHVKVLRWHTRVPVADPERVTADTVRALKCTKAVYVVVHINHPRELTEAAVRAVSHLIDAGIPVLSQSVLLRGVNDDTDTLERLMRALVEARVKPYYLHHADLAPGTAAFRTPLAEGRALVRALRAGASGLCQPEYVLDIPGGYAKARLAPCDIEAAERGSRIRDSHGNWHPYPAGNGGV